MLKRLEQSLTLKEDRAEAWPSLTRFVFSSAQNRGNRKNPVPPEPCRRHQHKFQCWFGATGGTIG